MAAVAAAVVAFLLPGAAQVRATTQVHPTAGVDTCAHLSTVTAYAPGWPEIRGTTNRGQLWVFGFGAAAKLPTAAVFDGLVAQPQPLKWVWHMTGTGPFKVVAIGPSGQRVHPVWGPAHHSGGVELEPPRGRVGHGLVLLGARLLPDSRDPWQDARRRLSAVAIAAVVRRSPRLGERPLT